MLCSSLVFLLHSLDRVIIMPSSSRLVLALLAAVLLVLLPSTSAQQGCYQCSVVACASFFNGTAPDLYIGAAAPAIASAECATLNTDIGGFIATAQNASCAANVAQLACQVIQTVNVTELNCNTSSIGVGTPFGNASYFQQRCASATGCLGYTFQDEVDAARACSSFDAFLGAVIAQPAPSALNCSLCNITSCYGLSSIGVTDVSFYAGSLPGFSGFACPVQQAVANVLLAGGNPGVPASAIQQAVCDPLAALTLVDSQAACAAGEVDALFDGIIFTAASAGNTTWQTDCLRTIPALFNPTLAARLIAAGYCVSPSAGLTSYALQFLLAGSDSSSSSSSSAAATAASSSSAASAASATTYSSSSSAYPSSTGSPVISPSVTSSSSAVSPAVVLSSSSSSVIPTSNNSLLVNAASSRVDLRLPAVLLLALSTLALLA